MGPMTEKSRPETDRGAVSVYGPPERPQTFGKRVANRPLATSRVDIGNHVAGGGGKPTGNQAQGGPGSCVTTINHPRRTITIYLDNLAGDARQAGHRAWPQAKP